MNMKELEILLRKKNVPQMLFSLNGGLPSEKYCIEEVNGIWQVYYSERGIKRDLRCFDNEEVACDYFLKELRTEISIM